MTLNKLIPHLNKLLLAVVFLILASSTIAWVVTDKTPPPWDPADHLSAAYDYYHELAHLDFRAFAEDFFASPHYYAPLVHLMTAGAFLLFGASELSGIAINILSLATLLISISWIGGKLYSQSRNESPAPQSEHTDLETAPQYRISLLGPLAALIASCYHFNAWLLHYAFLDYPLAAIVTVSFALLLQAGDFRVRRDAIIFGVAAGLGMLTKQTFAFFFVLPGIYAVLRVLATRDRRAIFNLALSVLVIVAVASIWYAPHLKDVIDIYRVNKEAALNENEAPLFGFVSNVYYFYGLVSLQIQLPLGLLFVSGLVYSLICRRRESLMLYLWLLSGIISFALVANKDMRYTVPILPAAALLSVCWVRDLKIGQHNTAKHTAKPVYTTFPFQHISRTKAVAIMKAVVAACAIAWSLVGFFNAQWPSAGNGSYIDMPEFRWMVFARNYYGFDRSPLSEDWSVPDIVKTVEKSWKEQTSFEGEETAETQKSGISRIKHKPSPKETVSPPTRAGNLSGPDGVAPPTLGVVVNLPYLNPSSVALCARLLTPEKAGAPVISVDWVVVDSARDRIDGCDYLLVRTGLESAEWVAPIEKEVEELIRANPTHFVKVASFAIPLKDAEAVIYKHRK